MEKVTENRDERGRRKAPNSESNTPIGETNEEIRGGRSRRHRCSRRRLLASGRTNGGGGGGGGGVAGVGGGGGWRRSYVWRWKGLRRRSSGPKLAGSSFNEREPDRLIK